MSSQRKQFDAVVIGGGVIGCAIAWRLAQGRMRVAVVERGEVGREASYAAGGMLAPLAEADRDDAFFRLAVASRALYASFAEELKQASGIDIEYRTEGTLYLALNEEDEEELTRRWQWQHAAGLNVKRLNAECVRKLEPLINDRLRFALKFPDDHQVNNRLLVRALEQAARNAGVEFLLETEVRAVITEAGRRVTGVATDRGELIAPQVVIAAGAWSGLLELGTARPAVEPVRGQMLAVAMSVPPVQHVIYSPRAYVIPRLGGFLIAGSTTEHVGFAKGVTPDGLASITERASEILPSFAQQPVWETWSGLRPRSSDEWPILGPDAEIAGLIYATGHYRNGILLTPVTADAIGQQVLRGTSRIDLTPFLPRRAATQQAR